ncbi:MAG: hypothetical protein ABSE15_03580 [Candidatus Bathyarchaeia archaeon]
MGNSEANFVKQDEQGKYYAVKDASAKVLKGYSKVGPALVPQLFFFSLLYNRSRSLFFRSTLRGRLYGLAYSPLHRHGCCVLV